MSQSLEQFHRDVIAGASAGRGAALARGAFAVAEPFYSLAAAARNALYSRGVLRSRRASRAVISVGNITTGGTGKTPVVRWLATKLIESGLAPAILTRGYRGGDEARLLAEQLPATIVEVDADRTRGAARVIEHHPHVNAFVLDDGFQHRRLHRDFDLVLIDASNPFGFDHVLPRGLLREPLAGLSRAHALLITRMDRGDTNAIESVLRRYNSTAPIYQCRHVHLGIRDAAGATLPMSHLNGRTILSVCAIGNPQAFEQQLYEAGARVEPHRYSDHHRYEPRDLQRLSDRAATAGAEAIVTTEKDWTKLAELVALAPRLPPIYRVELGIEFASGDGDRLLEQIIRSIESSPTPPLRGPAAP